MRRITVEMEKRKLHAEREARKKRREDGETDLPSPPGSVISQDGVREPYFDVVTRTLVLMEHKVMNPEQFMLTNETVRSLQQQRAYIEMAMVEGKTKEESERVICRS